MSPENTGTQGLDLGALQEGDFPVRSGTDLRVHVESAAYKDIIEHTMEKRSVEVCGVLVGNVFKDKHGAFLHVTDVIRGEHSASDGAEVTFTHDTWTHINGEMDRKHKDKKIVGWYHSHPGFGVFLSSLDLFIHRNFFSAPYQVAFVVDPRSGEEDVFQWRKDRICPAPMFWVGNEVRYTPRVSVDAGEKMPEKTQSRATGQEAAEKSEARPPEMRESEGDRILSFGVLMTFLLLCIAAVAGYYLGRWTSRTEATLASQQLLLGEVDILVRQGILKVGLEQDLADLDATLAEAQSKMQPVEGGQADLGGTRELLGKARQKVKDIADMRKAVDAETIASLTAQAYVQMAKRLATEASTKGPESDQKLAEARRYLQKAVELCPGQREAFLKQVPELADSLPKK